MPEDYGHRHRAGTHELHAFIEELGKQITHPIDAYLIGGCNMALRGLKDATKDLDAIVETRRERHELGRVLIGMGYEGSQVDPFTRIVPHEYEGFHGDLYRKAACVGVDVFELIVMDQFRLTTGMKRRVSEVRAHGKLQLHMVSNEDMCLFKAITNRPDDDDDVMTLIAQGLDVNTLRRALNEQPARRGIPWPEYVGAHLRKISTRKRAAIPWIDELL